MMKGQPKEDPSAKAREPTAVRPARTNVPRAPVPYTDRYVWDPFAVTAEFDRYFDAMRRNMESLVFPAWNNVAPRVLPLLGDVALPRADLRDEGEAYRAEFEVPGFAREDLTVEVSADRLELVAKSRRLEEREVEGEEFIAHERTHRELRRVFEFPEKILPDKVLAELKDGVLSVRAVKEKPTPHEARVRVKVA